MDMSQSECAAVYLLQTPWRHDGPTAFKKSINTAHIEIPSPRLKCDTGAVQRDALY